MSLSRSLSFSSSSTRRVFAEAATKWRAMLAAAPALRDVVFLQVASNFAFSGAQMTLLPLHLAASSFSPAEVATCFAAYSVGSLLAAQPVAKAADQLGKHRVLALGAALLSVSAVAVPHTQSLSLSALLVALAPMSVASACLSSTPTAIVSDLSAQSERAQAMSLLRTTGDLGLMSGAVVAGLVATHSSLGTAFYVDAAVVAAAITWFGGKYMRMKTLPSHHKD